MQPFDVSVTKRVRRRKLVNDREIEQTRWFVNFRDPDTGQRKLPSFETKREAEAFRTELLNKVHAGVYVDPSRAPTVAEAMAHYLSNREPEVKASTLYGYKVIGKVVTGPLLEGTVRERAEYTISGDLPRRDARLLQLLGPVSTADLTTAQIRNWHRTVMEQVGRYTANRALSMLKAALALCEEDFRVRAPAMPSNVVRRQTRAKKAILAPEQVAKLLTRAKTDPHRGIYYAFPFLAGTRISEQLGLLWDDVDFVANAVHIRCIQERDGSLTEATKTEAGVRSIPMSATLREMLLAWRLVCPRTDGKLHRVFPGPGRLQPWPLPRRDGGGPLLYQNFRKRFWVPAFKALKLPYVTPHAARHSFISTLQAHGVEVGLVAKLAGHANATVTLGHYTQAVRGGEDAIARLDLAYGASGNTDEAENG
jgi:integrase|tara:strand:- start:1677 stop:2945 length:1269 start_codon:yes stop_codon:yes gene_type:complete